MSNVQLCGLHAADWSHYDQLVAETQAGVKQLAERDASEQARHMQLRVRLHGECQQDKETTYLATVRVVMINARKWHRRPGRRNDQLLQDLFGLDWNQAQSMCKRLSIDPKGSN